MAILVKSPITSNGRDPIMDGSGKITYKETILEDAAKAVIEKQNDKRPTHLKYIVSEVPKAKVKSDDKDK